MDSLSIREVVAHYEESTTGPDRDRLQNTKRKSRWSVRLARYLLRIADEIDRLHALLERQGEMLRKHRLHQGGYCCQQCGYHATPHRGCILR